jgi:hypothetical protein
MRPWLKIILGILIVGTVILGAAVFRTTPSVIEQDSVVE